MKHLIFFQEKSTAGWIGTSWIRTAVFYELYIVLVILKISKYIVQKHWKRITFLFCYNGSVVEIRFATKSAETELISSEYPLFYLQSNFARFKSWPTSALTQCLMLHTHQSAGSDECNGTASTLDKKSTQLNSLSSRIQFIVIVHICGFPR